MNEVETLSVSMEMPILVFNLCLGTDAAGGNFSEKLSALAATSVPYGYTCVID